MKYTDLKRFLDLQDQIKVLDMELSALKDAIKDQLGDHGGEIELGGIVAVVGIRTRTNTDLESLAADIGVEKLSKYQSSTEYKAVSVKAKGAAVKKRHTREA